MAEESQRRDSRWKKVAEAADEKLSQTRAIVRAGKEQLTELRKTPMKRALVDGVEALAGGFTSEVVDAVYEDGVMGIPLSLIVGGGGLYWSASTMASKAEKGEELGMEQDAHSFSLGVLGGAGRSLAQGMEAQIKDMVASFTG